MTARTFQRAVLGTLGLVTFVSAAHASRPPQEPSAAPRPNIVLVLVDDLGWQDTALQLTPQPTAQNEQWHTPNLDLLAAGGMRFTSAYAAGPVCTPTRTSLLTGRTPGANHITYWTQQKDTDTSASHPTLAPPAWRWNGLDASDTTFPRLLAEAGYRTIHVGKAHFGAKDTFGQDPLALGFQVNIGGHAGGHPGSYLGQHDFRLSGRTGKPEASRFWDVPNLEEWHGTDTYLTEALVAKTCRALEESVRAGKPFFLNFAPYAVHTPLMANERLLARYADLDPREATYATMIESVDNALGTLMAQLEALGVADNTVILFTSDNGGLSAHARGLAPDGAARHTHNAPLKSGKGSAYEGGVRVPLAVRWPGHTPAGTWNEQPVITYDLFPTFLAMAGVELPDAGRVEGRDLGATLRVGTDEALEGRALFWNQPHQWGANGPGIEPFTSVRLDDWKLIYFHAPARLELFDLRHDVGETHDRLLDEPEHATELATRLADWIAARDVQLSLDKATGASIPGPLAVLAAQRLAAPEPEALPAPNLMLIVVDDLGWTDLSGGATNLDHGSDFYRTPHTDALARAGLSFTQAYSSGPNCAPTRAALMSGQWAARTGIYTVAGANRGKAELRRLDAVPNRVDLALETVTLAEALHVRGYETAHFGKWHLGGGKGGDDAPGLPGSPTTQGFDVNFGGDQRGSAAGRQFADEAGGFGLPGLGPNGQAGQWVDDRLVDEALEYLTRVEAPFFVNMSFFAVHTPIRAPAEDLEPFAAGPTGTRHTNRAYAGLVKSFDDNVGRLVLHLERTADPRRPGHKLIENTVVIFTSDNGGLGGYAAAGIQGGAEVTNNAPLRAGKGALYEGGIRVPLIVRWDAAGTKGATSSALTSTLDLFPTLLELAGGRPEDLPLDGTSQVGSWSGSTPEATETRPLFWHFPAYLEAGRSAFRTTPVSVIRRGSWKLLYFYEDRRFELFDLANDLGENHDLSGEQPELTLELARELSEWLTTTHAALPRDKESGVPVPLPVGTALPR